MFSTAASLWFQLNLEIFHMSNCELRRLTSISPRGGGCGCKLPQQQLEHLLKPTLGLKNVWPNVVLGADAGDDAAILKNPGDDLVLTTDVGTPTVDDPWGWGEMYTTHAISDVYAMGGVPFAALAVMGVPEGRLSEFGEVLRASTECLARHGVALVGGHTMMADDNPFFGLTVIGSVQSDRLLLKSTPKPGDDLVLTKPIGIGLYLGAHRAGDLDAAGYAELMAVTCQDNAVGSVAAAKKMANACADVTGWGLLGELGAMAKAGNVAITIDLASVPMMDRAIQYASTGYWTSGGLHNFEPIADLIIGTIHEDVLPVLLDPQTSGGLLLSCPPDRSAELISLARAMGNVHAARIGTVAAGEPSVLIAQLGGLQ